MGKTGKFEKRARKLERKRKRVKEKLTRLGIAAEGKKSDVELVCAGYEALGRPTPKLKSSISMPSAHSYYDVILRGLRFGKQEQKAKPDNYVNSKEFLESYEWRKLRYRILKKYGRRCMCCGAEPKQGQVHVDHIKPRRKFPELAFDEHNLQVLCHECNHGKGNWDQTDWREPSLKVLLGEAME